MERSIKNPSLIPEWFITSGGKVAGIKDANGIPYYFIGSSEKGEDGQTPLLRINPNTCKWEVSYDGGTIYNEVQVSPAASGLVGPQGETGPSGDSVKVDSIVNENGGTTVTLAWGENFAETSSFFVPSGLSGANGKDGTNGTDGKDGKDGISPTVTTATIQSDTTHKNGGIEVTISGADGEHKYSAWNGNNGETAGALPMYGGTGLNARLNGSQYNIDFSADYLAAIQSVSSKLNTNAFNEYTGITAPNTYLTQASADTLYQAKGNYISSANFDDDKVYGYTTEGWTAIDVGHILDAGSGISIENDKINAKIGTDLTFDDVTSAIKINTNSTIINGDYNFVEGLANTAGGGKANHSEGAWNISNGFCNHVEGIGSSAYGYGVHAQGMWTCFSSTPWSDEAHTDPTDIYWADGAGATVEGYCNATTSTPYSAEGQAVHGGILKVIGNGYRSHPLESEPPEYFPSDALILYRDGSLSAAGKISAAGIELGAEPDLSDYIPYSATVLPIGTSNTAVNNAATIGGVNSAINLSFALGNGNSAITTGCAIGERNYAYNKSVAIGYQNTANYNVDIAIGYQNSAYDHAASLINHNIAKTYSLAAGDCNTAINYSFTFGRGLKLDNTNGGSNAYGGLAIGGWNYTTADAMFVIGNGSPGTNRDYFVIKNDGSVAFGETTFAQFNGSFAEGYHTSAIGVGVRAVGAYTRFSVSNTADHAIYDWEGRGVTVEGYANATTAHPLDGNGNKIHDGVLKVVGNGGATSTGITGSDAYILYRDGTVSAKQFQNADGTETINGTTYSFTGVDNIEILPNAATANTANFNNDNVLRFILES